MAEAKSEGAAEVTVVRAVLRRIVGNAGLLLGGRGANAVLGLAYLAVAARALTPSDLGVLVLIHATAQLIGDLAKFQSWQTVLQYGAPALAEGRKRDFQGVVRFALILDGASALLGVTVGVGVALAAADRLGWGGGHAPAAALYMLTIAAMVADTSIGLMRLFDRFAVLARQTALVSGLRLVGSVIAFGLHAPLEGFLLAWAVGQLGGFAYLVAATVSEMRKRDLLEGFSWRGPLTRAMPGAWRFAWNMNLSASLDTAMTHVATLVVGGLAGPAQAAYWKIGRQVADAIAKPARLLSPALYPEFARLQAAGSQAVMWRLARHVALVAGALGIVLLGLTAAFGATLLTLVMGKAMAPAGAIMTWQVGAAVIGVFALPLEPMLISFGRASGVARVQLVVAATFLAALPFALHRFGLTGAAAGLVVAEAALTAGLLWVLRATARAGSAG